MPKSKNPYDHPIGFANCQECKRRRWLQNTLHCDNCKADVCNDCWLEVNGKNGKMSFKCPKCKKVMASGYPPKEDDDSGLMLLSART